MMKTSAKNKKQGIDSALLNVLLSYTTEVVVLVDAQGFIQYASPSVELISEYRHQEIVGRSIFDFIHPDDHSNYKEQFFKALANPKHFLKGKARLKPKYNDYRNTEWYLNNQLNHPQVGYIIVTLKDVTKHKATKEELLKSEYRLKQAQEIAKIGNWELSFKTGENVWSDEIYRIFGLKPGVVEPSLQAYLSFIHPEDRERVVTLIKHSKTTFEPISFTHRIIREDGEVRILENDRRFTFDENGEAASMYGILHDITEQVEIEQALKEHATHLEEVFNIARIGTWKYSISKDEYTWNKSAIDVIGFNSDEIPKTWQEYAVFIPDDQIGKVEKSIVDSHDDGILDVEHQIEIHGKRKWVRIRSHVSYNEEGEPDYVVGAIQDVDNIKTNETKLEKALEEKTALLAEVHHRVKNNLAIISGLLELQRMEADDKSLNDSFNQSINRISSIAMVHELLYQSEEFSSVDIYSYLDRLIPGIKDTISSNRKKIDINLDIENYQININQAIPVGLLLNELLTNSFKYAFYGRKTGVIDITLKRIEKNRLQIVYQDNGVGFREDVDFEEPENLGLTLIHTQLQQLGAKYEVQTNDGFQLSLSFKARFREGQLTLPLS